MWLSDERNHCFQALAQCEHTLAKFGVSREAVDDTAGAAKVKFFYSVYGPFIVFTSKDVFDF